MPMVYQSWEAREPAHAFSDIGWASLAYCRAARGCEGVVAARYWAQGTGRIAILVETEPEMDATDLLKDRELAKAGVALNEIARQVDLQEWADPRVAARSLESTGIA